MPAAVVDTSVLVGFADSDDQHHETAAAIVRGIDTQSLPTGVVIEPVLIETFNWIHRRQYHEVAVELLHRLEASAGFELAATTTLSAAGKLFERFDGLSFGDASILAYMQREGLSYCYLFDEDFDAVGSVVRLDTPTNPFGAE